MHVANVVYRVDLNHPNGGSEDISMDEVPIILMSGDSVFRLDISDMNDVSMGTFRFWGDGGVSYYTGKGSYTSLEWMADTGTNVLLPKEDILARARKDGFPV